MSAIARTAGVDRTFLYGHLDLLSQVHLAQERPAGAGNGGPAAAGPRCWRTRPTPRARSPRQAARVRQLEAKLSQMLGEQALARVRPGHPRGHRRAQTADHRA